MNLTLPRAVFLLTQLIALILCPGALLAADQTVDGHLTVTGDADVFGRAEVGSFRINTNNDPATHQRHAWRRFSWGGGGTSNWGEWKKVARLYPNGALNSAIAFEGRVFDHRSNYASQRGVSIPFSGMVRGFIGTGDPDNNTARIAQGQAESGNQYVRVVRVAENDFELQVRQAVAWRWMEVEWRITGDAGGSQVIQYFDTGSLGAGSTATVGNDINPTYDHFGSTGMLLAGKIGIGTTSLSQTAALDVAGDIKLSGNIIKGGTTLTLPAAGGTLVTTSGTQTITGTTNIQGTTTLGGATSDKQLSIDSSTGNVGIGGQYPSKLYVSKLSTDPTTAVIGARSDITLSSGASTASVTGLYAQSAYDVSSTGNHTGGLIGVRGVSRNNNATYNVAWAHGVQGEVYQLGAGSITDARALHGARPYFANFGGTITNATGLYIDTQKIAGVTNGYGVYQAGTTDTNFFAGNVGIGTTPAPAAKLDVNGNAQITGNLTIKNVGATKSVIRISPAGDIDMGSFTSGNNPN